MPAEKRSLGGIVLPEQSAPGTPPANSVVVYAKSDGKVYRKDDAGTEAELGGSTAVSLDTGRIVIPAPGDTAKMLFEQSVGGGMLDAYIKLTDGSAVQSLDLYSGTSGITYSLLSLSSDGIAYLDTTGGLSLVGSGTVTTTSGLTLDGPLYLYLGTGASLPGIHSSDGNDLRLRAWGYNAMTFSDGVASLATVLYGVAGSVTAPSYSFAGDPDTGLYRVGTNHVGIAAAGSLSASFTANSTRFSDGTAGAPGITFQSDTNTGILRSAADTMQFSCGGTVKMALASGAVIMDLAASATAYQPVHRDPTFGVIVRYTSSRRFKERIETFDGADLVSQLRPVTFYPKEGHGDPSRQSVGFIAEEVADVDTRLTTTGPDGEPDGLDTNAMLAALTGAVQDLQAELQSLRKRVAELEARA